MEKIYKPIHITDNMINTKSYTIPIDKENFIAILDKDTKEEEFYNTLCGKLYEILGHGNADYNAMIGSCIYIDIDLLNHDNLIIDTEKCINTYTLKAREESDFFSDGE